MASTQELVNCPICYKSFSGLYQLNNHIDFAHSQVSPSFQPPSTNNEVSPSSPDTADAIVSWFKSTASKVIQNKKTILTTLDMSSNYMNESDPNMENIITKSHWEKEATTSSNSKLCPELGCQKPLNMFAAPKNCRKCGKLYCDDHVSYQMKLSPSAQHDPEKGIWCRVCRHCYEARPEYHFSEGARRSWKPLFDQLRSQTANRAQLEVNLLQKRLKKLSEIHASHRRQSITTGFVGKLFEGPQLKEKEREVVAWEEDLPTSTCYRCNAPFFLLANRRHHCRLCGRIVCANGCSLLIPLSYQSKPNVGEVRVCSRCHLLTQGRQILERQKKNPPLVVMHYQEMVKLKEEIMSTLPKFNNLLGLLSGIDDVAERREEYLLSAQYRKELIGYFTHYDKISKDIERLPFANTSEQRLYSNIRIAAHQFLQLYMITLRLVPRFANQEGKPKLELQADNEVEGKRKGLQEKMDILLEQKAQTINYIQEAKKKRKFEDVQSLETSLQELESELSLLEEELRGLFSS